MVRFLNTAVLLLVLAGCTPPGPPEGSVPLELETYRTTFLAEFPNAQGARLSVQRKGDFDFYFDGRASFGSATSTSGLVTDTEIESFSGSQLCLAPQGGWSGICIDIFELADGSLFCAGRFGNGVSWRESCAFSPL